MREICMSGSMRRMWKRSDGPAIEAPPDERGGTSRHDADSVSSVILQTVDLLDKSPNNQAQQVKSKLWVLVINAEKFPVADKEEIAVRLASRRCGA